jgi:tetratricopeptide (TPR) repeat protein
MEESRRCTRCGQSILPGEAECPRCNAHGRAGTYRAETVLVFSLIVLAILFVVTGFAAQMYHTKERALGEEWCSRGLKDLKASQPEKAIVEFRTALLYYRENRDCELNLAKGLLAANHVEEARAHLTRLWEREPENGEVNLELGRLAARNQDIEQALRYFHNSIYGDWQQEDAAEQRRKARLELYQFLLSRGAGSQAQAELMALAAELPPDPHLHVQVGRMFLQANEYDPALKQFRQALQLDRNDQDALSGAAETEFQTGDYSGAQLYLERAARKDPQNTELTRMLETTRLVLSIDPYETSLSGAERSVRIMRAYQQAVNRLQECAQSRGETLDASPPQTPLQSLYDQAMKMKPRIRERVLNRDPDTATAALTLVSGLEGFATSVCGEPKGLDEAIVLAQRDHGGNQK